MADTKNTQPTDFALTLSGGDTMPASTVVARSKTFKTGSRGFNVTAKVLIDGRMHQLSANLVEIGSGKGS